MPIITLTTDLGSRDHYAASLKGVLCSLAPGIQLIDVTHEISHFNILEAAFILKSCFGKFPVGSIHIVAVDPEGSSRTDTVVMEYKDHLFVAPDNGVLSLIRMADSAESIKVDDSIMPPLSQGRAFLALRRLAPTAALLATGGGFEEIGEPHQIKEFYWGEPSYTENSLRGVILHIDHFGNAITNITKDEFMRLKGDRSFQLFIRSLRLPRIVTSYGDVSKGEALAIFSESGHLEIAIREGSAAQLLGFKVHDMLTIEYYG